MAHENCFGRWEKSTLGGTIEGNGVFIIDPHNGDVITGRHEGKGGLAISGKCDGTKMRFVVVDTATGDVTCYVKGKITAGAGKFFINGKFRKPLDESDVIVTDTEMVVNGLRVLLAADDWTAEKPT